MFRRIRSSVRRCRALLIALVLACVTIQPAMLFACDLHDIGVYIRTCEAAMDQWRARDPARVRLQEYERLLAAFEHEVRALLDACGLAFDPRCLEFHRAVEVIGIGRTLATRALDAFESADTDGDQAPAIEG